jgi:hypothetical protein
VWFPSSQSACSRTASPDPRSADFGESSDSFSHLISTKAGIGDGVALAVHTIGAIAGALAKAQIELARPRMR